MRQPRVPVGDSSRGGKKSDAQLITVFVIKLSHTGASRQPPARPRAPRSHPRYPQCGREGRCRPTRRDVCVCVPRGGGPPSAARQPPGQGGHGVSTAARDAPVNTWTPACVNEACVLPVHGFIEGAEDATGARRPRDESGLDAPRIPVKTSRVFTCGRPERGSRGQDKVPGP